MPQTSLFSYILWLWSVLPVAMQPWCREWGESYSVVWVIPQLLRLLSSCKKIALGVRRAWGSGMAQLWLWGRWVPGRLPHPATPTSSMTVGSNRPRSSLPPLCIILPAYIEFSVFLLASSSFSFDFFFFPVRFWCQDIYSFSLYGSHTIIYLLVLFRGKDPYILDDVYFHKTCFETCMKKGSLTLFSLISIEHSEYLMPQ